MEHLHAILDAGYLVTIQSVFRNGPLVYEFRIAGHREDGKWLEFAFSVDPSGPAIVDGGERAAHFWNRQFRDAFREMKSYAAEVG